MVWGYSQELTILYLFLDLDNLQIIQISDFLMLNKKNWLAY